MKKNIPQIEYIGDPMNHQNVHNRLIKIGFTHQGHGLYRGRLLFLRLNDNVLEMAERKTFDRWANSTNFKVELNWDGYYHQNPKRVEKAIKQARKIIKSKLFDFNSYFHTIELE